MDTVIIDDTITWGDSGSTPAGGSAPHPAADRGETRSTADGARRSGPVAPRPRYTRPPLTDAEKAAYRARRDLYDQRDARRAAKLAEAIAADPFGYDSEGNKRTPRQRLAAISRAKRRAKHVVLHEPWRFDDKTKAHAAPRHAPIIEPKRTRGAHGGEIRNPDQVSPEALRSPAPLVRKARALGLTVTEYDTTLSMAIRRMDGGRPEFLRFVALAAADHDEDAQKFLDVLHELKPYEQRGCSFDLVCLAAGVSPVALVQSVVGIAMRSNTDVGNLVAAVAHPAIVETTIRSAKRVNSDIGAKDRHALLQHHGFLPTPKGATINVTANASAQSAAAAEATSADASVPKFLSAANVASSARESVQKQLTEGVPAALPDLSTVPDAELVDR